MNVHDDYRLRPVVSRVSTMKTKADLLVRKMKADTSIAWSEKGELKYKGETVRGSNVVDLVNDVLRKKKYFNPQ